MLSLLIPLFLAFPPAQEAAQSLPDGVLARVGGVDLTLEAYKDFLWRRFGTRGLREFIGERLVAHAALEHGVIVAPEAIQAKVDERVAAQMGERTLKEFREEMTQQGANLDEYRQQLHAEMEQTLLLDSLVMATRKATDEKLQRAFEVEYGLDGVQVKIRHMAFMPNMLRMQAVRAGTLAKDINMTAIKQQAKALAQDALARLQAGDGFAELAIELSHDRTSRESGGELPHWNGRMYGPAFADAVAALKVGQHSALIETTIGFHIIQLDERVVTDFDSGRGALTLAVSNAPVSQQERRDYLESLHRAANIQRE